MSLLDIQHVAVTYPDGTRALTDCTLQAKAGEIVGIIGRSGAGKSTLLRTINGLQDVSAGAVRLHGENLAHLHGAAQRAQRRRAGFIWQEANLVGRLTTFTNVLLGRLGHNTPWHSAIGYFPREDRARAVYNLERVHLVHRATQRADRLSGGEKQRCAIARALTQEPEVLLCDEPVASLDPELAWQVMRMLAELAREDRLLTLVNIHQVDLARAFCDRIVGIADGRVVFDGPPDTLNEDALEVIYRGAPAAAA